MIINNYNYSKELPQNLSQTQRRDLQNEVPIDDFLPYSYHYSTTTLKTHNDRMLRVFEIKGVSSHTAIDEQINAWHHQLHGFFRVNSDPNIAFWTHIIKEEANRIRPSELQSSFSKIFDEKYKEKLNHDRFYNISLFITAVVKTNMGKMPFLRLRKDEREGYLEDAKAKLDQISSYLKNLDHQPRELGIFEHNGQMYSEPGEFLSRLVSGVWQAIPVTNTPVSSQIGTSRINAGKETIGIVTATENIYCAGIGLKDYMPTTDPLMFSRLLEMPFPFILSQSFFPTDNQAALATIKKQKRMLISSEDGAKQQIMDIDTAINELSNRDVIFGEHNFSLFVYTDSNLRQLQHETRNQAIKNQIKDRVAYAIREMGDCGAIAVREDIALVSQYFAMLPSNSNYRARVSLISSANFSCFFPMHSIATGRWESNHWGQSVLPLKTNLKTIYDFNYHAEGTDLGHTLILGLSGAGKTVFQMALLAQAEKFNAKVIHFDYMRGAEIFFRAIGGQYEILETGKPTGFNPYQLPPTAENLIFLTKFTLRLAYGDEVVSPHIKNVVSETIRQTLTDKSKRPELRNLSEIYRHFQDKELRERLFRWTKKGALGWLFDNRMDTISFDGSYIGIDTTDFLDDKELSVPVFMYLTHRIEESFGTRFIASFDEIWKMIGDPVFMPWIKKALKTFRRANGLFIGATQETNDVLDSPIASTLIGQCPTKIFLPNHEADREAYRAFKVNDVEYDFILAANPKDRRMLLKQGNDSIIVTLDLRGLDEELAVLSTREANIPIMYDCIKRAGNHPDDWLPLFYQEFSHE